MTRQDAINWANSKIGQYLDYDGLFGTQCVDFFNYCYEYLTGLKPYAQGLGVAYAYQLASKRPAGLTWIPNNPNDPNQLPSDGDLIIMSGANGFGGGAGHVLMSKNTDSKAVRGIDETPNTKVAARQYQWTNVLGWFVPNTFNQAPQGGNMVTDKAQLDRLYLSVMRRPRGAGEGEDVYLGKDSGWVHDDLYNSPERRNNLKAEEDHLKQLEELANKPSIERIVEKIVEKPVEVIKEVYVEVPVEVPTQPMTWVSVLDFVRDQLRIFLRIKS